MNEIGEAERAFCECDKEFVDRVKDLEIKHKNYDTDQCESHSPANAEHAESGECCEKLSGLFVRFNPTKATCCAGAIKAIGAC